MNPETPTLRDDRHALIFLAEVTKNLVGKKVMTFKDTGVVTKVFSSTCSLDDKDHLTIRIQGRRNDWEIVIDGCSDRYIPIQLLDEEC